MEKIPENLKKALKIIKFAGLDDWIYDVRDREGKGWDGPKVKSFSKACDVINSYLRGDK